MGDYTGPRQDAVKKRREYLRRKGAVYAPLALALLLHFVMIVFLFRELSWSSLLFVLPFSLFDFAAIPDALFDCRLKIAGLPHVPTVREQLAALPAVEVLLRGSDRMGAATDELLRGARPELETERGELLRPSNEKTETSGL